MRRAPSFSARTQAGVNAEREAGEKVRRVQNAHQHAQSGEEEAETMDAKGERRDHRGQTGRCGRFGSGQSTWKNFPRGASTRS